jgi:hypothetical protein
MNRTFISLLTLCLTYCVVFGGGLTKDELRLASCTVVGKWVSYHVLLPDTTQVWSGSAGVIGFRKTKSHPKGVLVLITNSHVTCLSELSASAYDDKPVILAYEMGIIFPSGKQKPVLAFAEEASNKDLATLVVDADGLAEGKDYASLPNGSNESLTEGNDVVAVGSPKGLSGTQTFGKISALRQDSNCVLIQTDAAINHGNSGGPLFLKKRTIRHPLDGEFLWVGVNTCRFDDAQGLGFAISTKDAMSSKYSKYYSATKEGAAKNICEIRRINASSR